MTAATTARRLLKKQRVKFIERNITDLTTADVISTPVVLVSYRRSKVYAIVRESHVGKLLGNEPLNELAVKFSGFEAIGASVGNIVNSGAFNAIRLSYYDQHPAVVIDTEFLGARIA